MKWTPELVIVLVVIVGSFCLIALGIDGEVKSILAVAVGWVCRLAHEGIKLRKGGE